MESLSVFTHLIDLDKKLCLQDRIWSFVPHLLSLKCQDIRNKFCFSAEYKQIKFRKLNFFVNLFQTTEIKTQISSSERLSTDKLYFSLAC